MGKRLNEVALAMVLAANEFQIPVLWMVAFGLVESDFEAHAGASTSYKGLYQFHKTTWNDVRQYITLPPYDIGWMDPLQNARAAAMYMRMSIVGLKRRGYNAHHEPRWVYMAHQQGVNGLSNLLDFIEGKSDDSGLSDKKMICNKAPYTKETTDPEQWYNNWMNYLSMYYK
jgi:hypothetical protein